MEVEPAAAPAAAEESAAAAPASSGDQATPDPAAAKTDSAAAAVTAESKEAPSADAMEGVVVEKESESKNEEKPEKNGNSATEEKKTADVKEEAGAKEEATPENNGSNDEVKTDEDGKKEVKTEDDVKEEVVPDDNGEKSASVKSDDAKSGEAKATTPKKAKESSPPPVRSSGRSQRVRKSVEPYDPAAEAKEKKELVIPKGKGEMLEDMPRVVANLKGVTWSDPHLKMLHNIIFGRGQKKDFKAHLLKFSGVVYPEGKEEEEQEKLKLKMYKLVMGDLKEVMDLCDIDRSAESFGKKGTPDKELLCDRFLEWLENPKGSGKKVKTPKKTTPAKKSPAPKTDSAKKRGRPKGSTKKDSGSAKKAKGVAKAEVVEDDDDEIDFNIPGTTIEKVREKVRSIVDAANREELTVKGVREMLEKWLDTDLSGYKDVIRSLVMDAM